MLGTLNPSSGDVSVFLPTEQALVSSRVDAPRRPWTFARYNLGAIFAGAVGALVSGIPEGLAHAQGWDVTDTQQASFLLYTIAGAVIFLVYRHLAPHRYALPAASRQIRGASCHTSRRTVLELGAPLQSRLRRWRVRRDVTARPVAQPALRAVGTHHRDGVLRHRGARRLLAAARPRLARRLGLVRTMVFTHLPANVLLFLAAFAPNGGVAIALLLGHALLSQMDVPARQSFVMAIVPPDERAAAASVTNVPRSLAAAATPLLAGALLARTTFGWPLVIAGAVKAAYDVLLLVLYRNVAEEVGATRTRRPSTA